MHVIESYEAARIIADGGDPDFEVRSRSRGWLNHAVVACHNGG